jgi:ABC-type antimicrobial peptide transport system permease subunit
VAASPKVAVVNRTFAERHFQDGDAIGRQFGDTALTPSSIKTIVGVVEDIREGPLDAEIWPAVYYPFAQDPDTSFSLVVRTADTSGAILPGLRATIAAIEPDLGIIREATLAASIGNSPTAYLQRSSAWVVGGFAALAWLLGSVGLYGVMAYAVGQRTRELAVRVAVGAGRRSLYSLVLGDALRVTAVGLVSGLALAVGAATLGRRLLFDTAPWDLATLGGVAVALALSALLASLLPARRAASVDPVTALRAD